MVCAYSLGEPSLDINDYFYFSFEAAHTIELWLTGIQPGADNNLYLLDRNRVRIGYSGNVGSADDHILTGVVSGERYVIRVQRLAGSGPYSLRVVYQ